MKHWNTQAMVKMLSAVAGIAVVETHFPGGDVDSDTLVLRITGAPEDEKLFVAGFRTDHITIKDQSDFDVEMIEVTDGQQSDTGLSSSDTEVCVAYARVCAALRQAGFQVVESMDAYF